MWLLPKGCHHHSLISSALLFHTVCPWQMCDELETTDKLKEKLKNVNNVAIDDATGEPINWETKYQMQVELKARLEKNIIALEKQNKN